MRTVKRPRRYLARHWLLLASPLFTYNFSRDAYVLRGVGRRVGPVLREDRRTHREPNRRPWADRSWDEGTRGLQVNGGVVERRRARA